MTCLRIRVVLDLLCGVILPSVLYASFVPHLVRIAISTPLIPYHHTFVLANPLFHRLLSTPIRLPHTRMPSCFTSHQCPCTYLHIRSFFVSSDSSMWFSPRNAFPFLSAILVSSNNPSHHSYHTNSPTSFRPSSPSLFVCSSKLSTSRLTLPISPNRSNPKRPGIARAGWGAMAHEAS